jgi:hypothetical protein
VCHETTQYPGGIAQQPAYNAGVDARKTSGAIDAVVPLDSDAANMDMDPSHGNSTDGLHYVPARMDAQGQMIANTLLTA